MGKADERLRDTFLTVTAICFWVVMLMPSEIIVRAGEGMFCSKRPDSAYCAAREE